VAKAPEEGRTGGVVAAVHDDKKILAQNRVVMKAKFERRPERSVNRMDRKHQGGYAAAKSLFS